MARVERRPPLAEVLVLVGGGAGVAVIAIAAARALYSTSRRCRPTTELKAAVAERANQEVGTVPREIYEAERVVARLSGGLSQPFVLVDLPLGGVVTKWTPRYLADALGDSKVSVHVSTDRGLNFVSKNFSYAVMPFAAFLDLASAGISSSQRSYYYYRSQHVKRNKPSSLDVLGPLATDFQMPARVLELFSVHSTVLRVASAGLQMWLHYDVCDNFLCCVRGRKRVALLPPSAVGNFYIDGSSSVLGSRLFDEAESLESVWREFPLARSAWAMRLEVILEEGETLFIPALWLHCTEALPSAREGASTEPCVSVNVFVLRPELEALHDPKDVWANRELLPAQEAFKAFDEKFLPPLGRTPALHRAFYCRKAAATLLAMAVAAEEPRLSGQRKPDAELAS